MLLSGVSGPAKVYPLRDRIMMCGGNAIIHDMGKWFEAKGFDEGSNAQPGEYVSRRRLWDRTRSSDFGLPFPREGGGPKPEVPATVVLLDPGSPPSRENK